MIILKFIGAIFFLFCFIIIGIYLWHVFLGDMHKWSWPKILTVSIIVSVVLIYILIMFGAYSF